MRRALIATLLAASAALALPASAAPDLKCIFLYDPETSAGAVYVVNCVHPILP